MSTWIVRLEGGEGPDGPTRVAVKDLVDMAGLSTTCGARALSSSRPAIRDAACLAGIRAAEKAGEAVIVGKTNLHELAFGVSGVNPWFGTPVNPVDPSRVPGGSSSGSAVAVATGEAVVALGTDTGGSIRIPAACCGVAGLKTTRGRIPLEGVQALAPSLDTVGPMGATVSAVGLGMELLEPGFEWRERAPARRIGRFRPAAAGWVDAAVDAALSRWASAGRDLDVVEIELPGWARATEAVGLILLSEAWSVHGQLWREHSGELSPEVAQRLEAGSLIDRAEVAAAWEEARRWSGELAGVFGSVDLIALPVLADAPPSLDDAGLVTSIRHTAPFNLAGLPAMAVPVPAGGGTGGGAGGATGGRAGGPAGGGLPASLQLAGPARSEALILATALSIETA